MSLKRIKIKPIMTVVCDDIRQENNGKTMIIGIYNSNIILEKPNISAEGKEPPTPLLSLSLWMPYNVSEIGDASFFFEVVSPSKKKVEVRAGLRLEKMPPPQELLAVKVVGIPVPIEREGDITIKFKNEDDEEWVTLKAMPVTFMEPQ